MKRLILCFTMAATVTASIATGCSSQKDASDTTAKDTIHVATPASGDTTIMDTAKKDTTRH